MSSSLGFFASQISGHLYTLTGSYDSIATATVTSGGASTITFSSIPSTYTHLQIRAITRDTASSYGYNVNMRFNSDSSSSYTYHGLQGNGSSASAFGSSSATTQFPLATSTGGANSSGNFAGFICDVLDYANVNKNKTHRCLNGYDDNGSGYITLQSGVWLNTNTVSSITILATGIAFAQNATFSLFGIK